MLHKLALLLVIVAAVNVGLVSWIHVDLVAMLFGELSHVISVLIGLSGIYMLLDNYTTLLKHS